MPLDLSTTTPELLRRRAGVKWTKHPATVLGAFVAEMDYGTAPEITEALHHAVELGQFGYLSGPLCDELALACRDWHTDRYGWTPDPDRIHALPDVIRGLEIAVDLYSPPGSPVILPTPAYMPFFDVPGELGRDVLTVPMRRDAEGRYRFDLPGIAAAFEAGGGVLVLCNPCNPVGRVFERAELEALAEVVERCGGRVFADEIHAPVVHAPHRHVPYASVSASAAGHSVTATSASKAWNLPGLKCASLILTNDLDARRWDDVGLLASHGASTLGVVANTAAYRHGGPWLEAVLAQLAANARRLGEVLAAELPECTYTEPEGTYLAWIDVRPLGLGDEPAAWLLEHAGVALTEGGLCGAPGFVRLNLATTPALLEELTARIVDAVRRRDRAG